MLFGLLLRIGFKLSKSILPIKPDKITIMKKSEVKNIIRLTLLKT